MITSINNTNGLPAVSTLNQQPAQTNNTDFAQAMANAVATPSNTNSVTPSASVNPIHTDLTDTSQGLGKWQSMLNALLAASPTYQASLAAASNGGSAPAPTPSMVMPPATSATTAPETPKPDTALSLSDIVASKTASVNTNTVTSGPTSINNLMAAAASVNPPQVTPTNNNTINTTASTTSNTSDDSDSNTEVQTTVSSGTASNYTSTMDMLSSRLAMQTNATINQKLTDIMSKL